MMSDKSVVEETIEVFEFGSVTIIPWMNGYLSALEKFNIVNEAEVEELNEYIRERYALMKLGKRS